MIEKPGSPITSQVINDLIGDPFFLDRSQPCNLATVLAIPEPSVNKTHRLQRQNMSH